MLQTSTISIGGGQLSSTISDDFPGLHIVDQAQVAVFNPQQEATRWAIYQESTKKCVMMGNSRQGAVSAATALAGIADWSKIGDDWPDDTEWTRAISKETSLRTITLTEPDEEADP